AWREESGSVVAVPVLSPELVVHGHCSPTSAELAENVADGPSVQRLIELAQTHHQVLSVGLSENDAGVVYNTQILVNPEKYIGKQRKLHMSRDEADFYQVGNEISVFDIGSCKISMVICYDNMFPEVARIAARSEER